MDNIYDDEDFFTAYAGMERSRKGLQGAGERHQLRPMFPRVAGRAVLDLGCGYGWHCKYAEEQGAARVLGLDGSRRMIEEARRRDPGPRETRFLGRTVPKQHHTLTQILGGLLSAGFTIGAVEEAMPPADMMDLPGMADELRRPMMLLVRGEKGWLSPSSPPGCRGAPRPGRRRCPGPGEG